MTRLYLSCGLCGHRQAGGLLSGAAWRRVDAPADNGSGSTDTTLHACPSCVEEHSDWQSRLLGGLRLAEAQAN